MVYMIPVLLGSPGEKLKVGGGLEELTDTYKTHEVNDTTALTNVMKTLRRTQGMGREEKTNGSPE